MRLLIASKNRGKIVEIRSLLGLALQRVVEVDVGGVAQTRAARETGRRSRKTRGTKALHDAKAHRILCIADDSGLAVEALGGLPGVRSARFAGEGASDAANNAHLLHELAPFARPWKAAFVCVASAALPNRVVAEATGRMEGEILPVGRGRAFGYDRSTSSSLGKLWRSFRRRKDRIRHRGAGPPALSGMEEPGLLSVTAGAVSAELALPLLRSGFRHSGILQSFGLPSGRGAAW